MFPKIEADLRLTVENMEKKNQPTLGRVLKFDYEKNRHVLQDGRFVECTALEAVCQYIEHVLRTELDKYQVYTVEKDEDFGISVYKYIGQKYLPTDYFASELKREITEQLEQHKYIEYVDTYNYEFKGRKLYVEFTCRLINGETASKEVIIDV